MAVKIILAIAAIFVVCQVLYFNDLSTPFQFDDYWQIVDNYYVQKPDAIPTVWQAQWRRAFLWLTFAANYRFASLTGAGEVDPGGFHLVNNSIHALNGVLVFILVMMLLARLYPAGDGDEARRRKNFRILAAWFAGMIFVLHPALTEGVTYISGRASSLCALFSLAALIFYIQARRFGEGRRFILAVYSAVFSVISFALALFSKEDGVALPFLILLVEIFFLSRGSVREALRAWPYWLVFGVSIAAVVGLTGYVAATSGVLFEDEGRFSFLYLLNQFEIVSRYIFLLLFPAGLSIDHAYARSRPFGPHLVPYIAFIVILLAAAVVLWRRSRSSRSPAMLLISASIFWFFLALAPTSSIVELKDWMVERRLYLASVFPIILAGIGLARVAGRAFAASSRIRAAAAVALVLAAGALGARTAARNHDYRSQLALWLNARQARPDDFRTRYSGALGWLGLASDFFNEGKYARALQPARNAAACLDEAQRIRVEGGLDKWQYMLVLRARVDVAMIQAQSATVLKAPDDPMADAAISTEYESALKYARLALLFAPDEEWTLKCFEQVVRSALYLGFFSYKAGIRFDEAKNEPLKEEYFNRCEVSLEYGIRMFEIGIRPWPEIEKPRSAAVWGRREYLVSHGILAEYYEKIGQKVKATEHAEKWAGGLVPGSPEAYFTREIFYRWLHGRLGG